MGKTSELSQDLFNFIVSKHTDGIGYRRIPKLLKVPMSTVSAIIWKWKENYFTINRLCLGSPCNISNRKVKRIIRRVVQEPSSTCEELKKDLQVSRYSDAKKTISNHSTSMAYIASSVHEDLLQNMDQDIIYPSMFASQQATEPTQWSFNILSKQPLFNDPASLLHILCLLLSQHLTYGFVAHSSFVQVYDPVPEIVIKLFGLAHVVEVRDYPALWDPADESYKDKYFRELAWTKIVRDLIPDWDKYPGSTQQQIDNDVRKRWRSIRDRFTKFLNECSKSGSSPSKSKFPFSEELQFLVSSRTLRKTEGNMSVADLEDSDKEDGAGSSSGVGGTISTSTPTASAESASTSAAAASTSSSAAAEASDSAEAVRVEKRAVYPVAAEKKKKKTKKNQDDQTVQIACDTLDLLKKSSSDDHCDSFAITVARKTRSLPPDRQSLFMSMVQMSLTALEDPAPISPYNEVLMGVLGLFRPRHRTPETQATRPQYLAHSQVTSGDRGSSQHMGGAPYQSEGSNFLYSPEYTFLN
ncbi:uncharacterized protein [Ranitomeya imitator]|uniref:uncharacterized protein n=1 Tax=Ranitomeya imitator TaxID=111125 RepID=UPI0037E87EE3